MPRQRQLELDDKPKKAPLVSTLIVTRTQIPANLTLAEKQILRENLDIDCEGLCFFFRECAAVRRVLRMRVD